MAGALYVLPVLAILAFWYIMLFVGNPPNPKYGEMLHFLFIEAPNRELFWYHAALPVICAAFAVAYLIAIAPQTTIARLTFGGGVILALSAWLMSNLGVAIFVTLPLVFSVKATWHLTARRSGP